MNAPRNVNYQDDLLESLKDPVEAAAYVEAILEMEDPSALLVALRQVAKAHGMTDVAPPRQCGRKDVIQSPERDRKPDRGHAA